MKFADCKPDKADSQEEKNNDTEPIGEDDYEGDKAGECSDGADNDRDGLFDCDDDTCTGAPDCKNVADVEATESGLSSVSLFAAVVSIGLIARFRRR